MKKTTFLLTVLLSAAALTGSLTIFQGRVSGAALSSLTPEEFLRRGAGVLLGEIVEVQVTQQDQWLESGTVGVKVVEVLRGNIEGPQLTLSYRRRRGPELINPHGWDLVIPEQGKKLIVYFREEDGTYSESLEGANPIEEVSSFDEPKIQALRRLIERQRPQ